MTHTKGLHHITALAGDPQQNADFYINKLGLRLVKKSVNQDDPGTYHLFYGNQSASLGSSITFFPWPRAVKGEAGTGEATTVAYMVPADALTYWTQRLKEHDVTVQKQTSYFERPSLHFTDPDGMHLQLVFEGSPKSSDASNHRESVPPEHRIRGFWGVTLQLADTNPTSAILQKLFGFEQTQQEGNRTLYQTNAPIGNSVVIETGARTSRKNGRGTIHHVAFRAKDEEELAQLRKKVEDWGLMPSRIIDRHWFKSVYFREPGGILFEMATDDPGYAVDEDPEHLGEKLVLPPWMESKRQDIEATLPELHL